MKTIGRTLAMLVLGTALQLGTIAGPARAAAPEDGTAAAGTGNQRRSTVENTWSTRSTNQVRCAARDGNAGTGSGRGFVDEDGDGTNDLAPDHDADGIPNGQDTDWVKNRKDGTGRHMGNGGGQGGGRGQGSRSSGCPRTR